MTANDHELLGQYTSEGSQDAFTALVNRHLNLVYSAALRQVRSPQLAEDVSLSVFTQLARHAATLAPDTILTAWLYRVTRNAAIDVVRAEARRQAREQIALQMNATHDNDTDWTQIEPLLDEAMVSLEETDRTAILLRFFENKSLREVGEAIGASEDAAQKRVSRALDRLREFLSKRKVAIGTAGLAALVSANAIQAAPAALAPAIATGVTTATAASVAAISSSSTAVAITKTIAMTTVQKTILAVVVAGALAGAVATALYQTHQVSVLKSELQTSKQKEDQQTAAIAQLDELRRERDEATNTLASVTSEMNALKKRPADTLKLRGEVGRLRKENAELGSTSALSKATANPEARKLLREQQKMGMSMIYKELAKQLKLNDEQTGKLNDLLADHIMTNVDHVTVMLRDKTSLDKMNEVFAAQDAALQQQLVELIGPDAASKYQEYTKNLLSSITADQFKGMLTGTADEKKQKTAQLRQLIQQEAQAVLAAGGLPADFQTIPMLNFSNIASEQSAEQSLKLLDDIYQRVAANASAFLSAAEIAKFREFDRTAITNNRSALVLNRTLMSPLSN